VECTSTDKPKEEIKILGTTVFINPFETDLKAHYQDAADKVHYQDEADKVHYQDEADKVKNAEAEEAKRKKKALEDREGHRDWLTPGCLVRYQR
ncbi:hypothetical protein T484DRAFT_1760693, partial [Baffinella frigidus]